MITRTLFHSIKSSLGSALPPLPTAPKPAYPVSKASREFYTVQGGEFAKWQRDRASRFASYEDVFDPATTALAHETTCPACAARARAAAANRNPREVSIRPLRSVAAGR